MKWYSVYAIFKTLLKHSNDLTSRPPRRAITVVVAGLAVAAPTSPAFAQDAPWGCQVLLCAAATSPSWSGIPYCVPPMEALFSQLARGGGWPSCPEGGETSGLGYQPYKPCPAPDINVDYQPATFGSQSEQITTGVFQADPNGAYCSPPEQISNFTLRQQQNTTYGQDTSGPPPLDFTPQLTLATANATPYYVDITPSGATSIRFYFSLQGY